MRKRSSLVWTFYEMYPIGSCSKITMSDLRKIANLGSGILLATGAILRAVYSFGGPEWSYWLGNYAFGVFFIVPGLTILFMPEFAVFWMRSFGGSGRGIGPSNMKRLITMQKLVLYTLAIMDLLIGSAILLTNLYQVVNQCSPDGDCPGL